ncbi:SRPBCC family protein [Glycomyces sp. A-F 0318]|uniref:SRPBCC family protein n=1 Tax=Glycomyces amatae TaxID=2881355 RepID=UPI001E32501F|nr:SRPBCC family protein [Glycomyces amatae]MCD0444134.1 SRPBCC family protein [Glycomyces amatae]
MILVEREIRATPAEVWTHLSALDRWAELLPTVDSIARVGDPGPIAVGSRFLVRQPGLAAAEYEVVDWRPDAGFTWVASASGIRTRASHELKASGAGTRLALAIEWSGPGAWVAKAFFAGKARRYVAAEAAAFAALAES